MISSPIFINTALPYVANPQVLERLGCIRYALFDFDGTLSVLREGWESVMIPMMLKCICGDQPAPEEIVQEVRDYVDRSTGVLTIKQMQWLAEAVQRYRLVSQSRTAAEYKALYIQEILVRVRDRQALLRRGLASPEDLMIIGSRAFLNGLVQRGVSLFLASGTDHENVLDEAACLGLEPFFTSRMYGALDANEAHDKERIIRRIIAENSLHGDELLVAGDGPVEIREALGCGAITLGVASNEVARSGWNEHKVRRLVEAGADLLVPDFSQAAKLLTFLFKKEEGFYW